MIYSHPQHYVSSSNYVRRGIGIALVALIHVGVIFAVVKATGIIDAVKPPPPLKAIFISQPIETRPVVPVEIEMRGSTRVNPDPVAPIVETQAEERGAIAENRVSDTIDNNQPYATILAARIDPQYPLTQPPYPPQSRRLGEQGRVELLVYVLPNGKIGEARVAQSSGFARLDDAAVAEALKRWRLLPNEIDGIRTGSWVTLAITFRLTQ